MHEEEEEGGMPMPMATTNFYAALDWMIVVS